MRIAPTPAPRHTVRGDACKKDCADNSGMSINQKYVYEILNYVAETALDATGTRVKEKCFVAGQRLSSFY
jgi:hypothetical protein